MSHHQLISDKIKDLQSLIEFVNESKLNNKKIVFTNGCFDLLHKGHVDYLSKARDKGDVLIVGVNTDSSVKRLGKSSSRPIQSEESRMYILAGLESVSAVVLFDEDTPYELIKKIIPNVLVKGADYSIDKIVGADIVLENNGSVETIDFIQGYSTSAIERKILDSVINN